MCRAYQSLFTIKMRALLVKCRGHAKALCRKYSKNASCAQISSVPDFSINQYDIVGFDLDHTICKYNLCALFELIYDSLAHFFVEKHGYPRELLERRPSDSDFIQKGIILDKSRGNFLKLDQDYKILKACHGTKLLSEDEIMRVYGNQRLMKGTETIPGILCSSNYMNEPFYIFKDYFVTIGAAFCMKVVDVLDRKNSGNPLPVYDFWRHFLGGLYFMYERENFKNGNGNFFPALKKNPELYLRKCSHHVEKWLKSIRESKRTFLLTSSNFDSAIFLAEYCLGRDWAKYFDVIVTFAKKPGFFSKSNPFYIVEKDLEISQISPNGMKTHTVYSQGNWNDLQQFFEDLCNGENPKVLYVGDSIIEDVFAPSQFAGCDTVGIVEEMLAEDSSTFVPKESSLLRSNFWGSFFASERNMTLWARILAEHAKIAVPNLETLSFLGLNTKVPSFGPSQPYSGYFPEAPFVFKS